MVSQANTKLNGIIRKFRDDFKETSKDSKLRYMQTLNAGSYVPEDGRLYSTEDIDAFEERCRNYRSEAEYILNDQLEEVHNKMVEVPASEVSAAIALLSARDNITEADIAHLVNAYGSNYQTYRALQDIAGKHSIYLQDHALTTREKDLNGLKKSLDEALNYRTISKRGDAFYDFASMQVDEVITD